MVDDQWLENEDLIASAAIDYYQKYFSKDSIMMYMHTLDCMPITITVEDNYILLIEPTIEEVKKVVFDIEPNNSRGPDGFTGCFFQKAWDIVGQDILYMVKTIFNGEQLPKFFTTTCLILIQKVDAPQSFSEFRPISLSNVSQKIIFKVLNERLEKLIPKIISHNQSGFIKGRSNNESVLLAQKIIHDIKKYNKG